MRVQGLGALPLHSKTQDTNVLEDVKLKSMQDMCTNPISNTYLITTSNFWISKICQSLTYLTQDFPVSLSALLESAKDSTTLDVMYFNSSLELSNSSNLSSCSLKIPQDYLTMTTENHSGKYYYHFGNVGMMRNGKLLTVNTLSHKTGKGSTLSQVLQSKVSTRYFHSHIFRAFHVVHWVWN